MTLGRFRPLVAVFVTFSLVLSSVLFATAMSSASPSLGPGDRVITENADGELGNNSSSVRFVKSDLSEIFFQSQASNLVPSAQNAPYSVHYYFADTVDETLQQFDVDAQGIGFVNPIQVKTVSADLRLVLYNRVLPNGSRQDELLDRVTGSKVVNPCGFEGCGNASAFTRDNTKLIYTVGNRGTYSRPIGEQLLVSYTIATGQRVFLAAPAMPTQDPIASRIQTGEGNWIYYISYNPRLTGGSSRHQHLVRENLVTGQIQVMDTSATGVVGNNSMNDFSVSADGQFIAFTTLSTNFAPGDADGQWRPYIKNVTTGALTPVARMGSGPDKITGLQGSTGTHSLFTSDNSLYLCTTDRFLVPEGAGAILRRADGTLEWFSPVCPQAVSADGRTQIYSTSPGPNETNYQGQQLVIGPILFPNESEPVATIDGPIDGSSYEFGAVPTSTCAVEDPIDGTVIVPVTVSGPTGPRSQAGLGSVVVTCSYVDSIGLTASARTSFTIVDTTPPVLSTPGVFRAEATGPLTPANFTLFSFDQIDGVLPYTCDRPPGSPFPVGDTTVTCVSTDATGNSSSATFVARITDTTPPAIAPHESLTVPAAGSLTAVDFVAPTAVDLVDGVVPVTCDPPSGSLFAVGSTTVACTATDSRGTSFTSTFAINVQDLGAPALQVPLAITAEAASALGAVVDYGALSATDNVDGTVVVSCDVPSGALFPLGETTVSCSATDSASNVGYGSFVVSVVDTTSPTLTVPAEVIVEASGPIGTVVTFDAPTAGDLVDGVVTVTCSESSGSVFGLGDTTVTCVATDIAGNAGSAQFTVRVLDTTAPILTPLEPVTVEATSPAGALVNYSAPSAVDAVVGPITPSCSPASGSQFAVGVTLVTCEASDAAGNTATEEFLVTVVDSTPPTIAVPANQNVRASAVGTAVVEYAPPTALDIVDGLIAPQCSFQSGDVFAIGSTLVECTATDQAGNMSSQSFTVTVSPGGPTIAVPANLVVEATSDQGAVVDYPIATAFDYQDGVLTAHCFPTSGGVFSLGTHPVECSATNAAGETATGVFTVSVVDTTAPQIENIDNISVIGNNRLGRVVNYERITAEDAVDGAVDVTCSPSRGSRFALGTTSVVCTATDAAGNASQTNFTVTVRYAWQRGGTLVDGGRYVLGKKIQVNVQLEGDSTGVVDATIQVWAAMVNGDSTTGPVVSTFSTESQGGNTLRYVPGQGLYAFVIDTKTLRPGVWQFTIDPGDGAPQVLKVTILAK